MNRFIMALAVLTACGDTTTATDTADTGGDTDTTTAPCPDGTFVGQTLVQSFEVTCVDTAATIDAFLTGLSAPGSPVIFMQETGSSYVGGQWSEEHSLDTTSFDECGFEEQLGQVIESLGVGTGGWADGSASVFTCDNHINEPGWMTYAVYVEDIDDGTGDCLALGADPSGLIAGAYDAERVGVEPSFALGACLVGVAR